MTQTPPFEIELEEFEVPARIRKQFGSNPFILRCDFPLPDNGGYEPLYFHSTLGVTHVRQTAQRFPNRGTALHYVDGFQKTVEARARALDQPVVDYTDKVWRPEEKDISNFRAKPHQITRDGIEVTEYHLMADVRAPSGQLVPVYFIDQFRWTADPTHALAAFPSTLGVPSTYGALMNRDSFIKVLAAISWDDRDSERKPFWGKSADDFFYTIRFVDQSRREQIEEDGPEEVYTRYYCDASVTKEVSAAEFFESVADAVRVAVELANAAFTETSLEEASDAAMLKLRMLGQVSAALTEQIGELVGMVAGDNDDPVILPIRHDRAMVIQVLKVTELGNAYRLDVFWQDEYRWIHDALEAEVNQDEDDEIDSDPVDADNTQYNGAPGNGEGFAGIM